MRHRTGIACLGLLLLSAAIIGAGPEHVIAAAPPPEVETRTIKPVRDLVLPVDSVPTLDSLVDSTRVADLRTFVAHPTNEVRTMSWTRTATGDVASIRTQITQWPASIAEDDKNASYLNAQSKEGHAAQVACAANIVESLCDRFGNRLIGISASGHADDNGAGHVNVSYSLTKIDAAASGADAATSG